MPAWEKQLIAVFGVLALVWAASVRGATITMHVHTWTDNPGGTGVMVPGDPLYYQIGVEVIDDDSNRGLATIVYDVMGDESVAGGYLLTPLTPADSGYRRTSYAPILHDVTDPMYVSFDPSFDGYNGGWGFDTAGLPTGGFVTVTPGAILSAGIAVPLTWTADLNPIYPGLQPYARQGVGQGVYTFPLSDPMVGGMQGGFGQVLDNDGTGGPIRPGDGTWLMQEGVIDTSAWLPQTYDFDLIPTAGAVYDATLDYNYDLIGFRVNVPGGEMVGTGFSFTLLPEPVGAALLVLAAAALWRRRVIG